MDEAFVPPEDTPGFYALHLFLFLPVIFFNLAPNFKYAPLGRAVPISLCALLAMFVGIVGEKEAFQKAIDHGTLLFLIGMMILAAYFEKKQILEQFINSIFKDKSPHTLLVLTSLLSGIFSAIITNDGVCILITPIIVKTCLERNIDPFPFLVAVCTSSNIGSGATLSGNPQNFLIGHLSSIYLYRKITWLEFHALCLPAAAVGLLMNTALLFLYYRNKIIEGMPIMYEQITFSEPEGPETFKEKILKWVQTGISIAAVIALVFCFAFGMSIPVVTMVGALSLVILESTLGRDPDVSKTLMQAVQWDIIIVFASLFITVHAFNKTHLPHKLWNICYPVMQLPYYLGPTFFGFISILLSTLVSNVPVVLMLAPEMRSKLSWIILSWALTVGGNFTLISSAANIIVDEKAKEVNPRLRLDPWRYFLFGAISTVLVTVTGIIIVAGIGRLYGYELAI